jgi:hypothetical protein
MASAEKCYHPAESAGSMHELNLQTPFKGKNLPSSEWHGVRDLFSPKQLRMVESSSEI